ncbi:MAG: molybdenum cofactor guanylyltransferase [Actinomycetota bacterium]|nr:molybdenum cofactor guanylyltransferase [Actinomycetota bacterium]
MAGYDAIVLAGGRASRMSGQAKPQLTVGEATMVDRVLSAVRGAANRVVVGPPQSVPDGVVLVQEQPAGGGPVAGMAAGLRQVEAALVVVLAADLPFLSAEVIASLLAGLDGDPAADLALLVDEHGRDQYLVGAWRTGRLRAALAELEPLPGRSMRDLVCAVRMLRVSMPAGSAELPPWTDVDTPADLERARSQAGSHLAHSPENVRSDPAQT